MPENLEKIMATLRRSGPSMSDALRAEIVALGPSVVRRLIALVEDPDAEPASIHAVDLLIDMKADEAIVPMLRVLNDCDMLLMDRIFVRLPELGAAVLEPALSLAPAREDEDVPLGVCEMLANLGLRDERIFNVLVRALRRDFMAAGALAAYGDQRALPLLEHALWTYKPNFMNVWCRIHVRELVDAHGQLGGVLPTELRRKVDTWLVRWDDIDRRLAEYAKPVAEVAENMHQLDVDYVIWTFCKLAVIQDHVKREAALRAVVKHMPEPHRREFAMDARRMIARHRKMFPEFHMN